MLVIAGTDPSGGAGLAADTRAIEAFGAHPCPVVTAVVAQNTRGVHSFLPVAPEFLRLQLEVLAEDITPRAIKIGMLPASQSIEVVARFLKAHPDIPVVLDTVFAPSSGPQFSDADTVHSVKKLLLPLCEIVTPNLPEAERLCGFAINDTETTQRAARKIHELGARLVLIKGGHATGAEASDLFFDGDTFTTLSAPRVAGYEVRGTGCMLASAIAAQRAQDVEPRLCVQRAKAWLTTRIEHAKPMGKGRYVATTQHRPSLRDLSDVTLSILA